MGLGDQYFNAGSNERKNDFIKRYELGNMENDADFYGKQADEYGASADAREANVAQNNSSAGAMASMGQAAAQGGSGADMAGNMLLSSGNPYAMAAGGALKVASMAQQRKQKEMDAKRAAFVERNERLRQSTDKLIAMDFGI